MVPSVLSKTKDPAQHHMLSLQWAPLKASHTFTSNPKQSTRFNKLLTVLNPTVITVVQVETWLHHLGSSKRKVILE